MDKFTRQDLSCNNKAYQFPPHEFFLSAAPFDPSNEPAIRATYDTLVSDGVYVPKGEKSSGCWQPEKVTVRSQDGSQVPNPSREQTWAALFDEVVRVGSKNSSQWVHLRDIYAWRSHGSHLVEGSRKPDIVLVPKQKQYHSEVNFSSLLTYCEVKETLNGPNSVQAAMQLQEISGYIAACQINRSFFLGSFLCGSQLVLTVYARGNTFFSKPIDINEEPLLFIKTIITMTYGLSHHLGFDLDFEIAGGAYTLKMDGFERDGVPLAYTLHILPQTYYRSVCWRGRGTKVPLCKIGSVFYVLKDTWLLSPGPNDVDNHRLYVTRSPRSMTQDEENLFSVTDVLNIFRDNKKTVGTEKWNDQTYLRGIPVLVAATRVRTRYDGSTQQDDTTLTILRRFSCWKELETYEMRVHYRTLSETCGAPLAWFSCRREFLNGMMCAAAGHFNGLLKGLLHCDPSEANIWWSVDNPLDAEDVIPDWPSDITQYPKRSAVLGDWGLAEDRMSEDKAQGGITGTYPFLSAELLSKEATLGLVCHEPYHDLEALFWVMWIVSVNSSGPYCTRREWRADPKPDVVNATEGAPTSSGPIHRLTLPAINTFNGRARIPMDAADGENKSAPIWATPGLHKASSEEVFDFKRDIPMSKFQGSMSPYWAGNRKAGEIFVDGMLELRNLFVWASSKGPRERITHQKFVSILAKMRDAIPAAEDTATMQDIEEARNRYKKLLQMGGDLSTSFLEIPENLLLPQRQNTRKSTSRANFPTAARLTNSKRKAEGPQLHTGSSSKRQRVDGVVDKNEGADRPPSLESRGRRNTRSRRAMTNTPTMSNASTH